MTDNIYRGFLTQQCADGIALAQSSDILELTPLGGNPPDHFLARFRCHTLMREPRGEVVECQSATVGIYLPPHYLRQAEAGEVVTLLDPPTLFHPNVRAPFICLGRLMPGTTLVEILHQLYEIITFQKVTMREDNALNLDACQWCRNNLDQLPLENRPLRRRKLKLKTAQPEEMKKP